MIFSGNCLKAVTRAMGGDSKIAGILESMMIAGAGAKAVTTMENHNKGRCNRVEIDTYDDRGGGTTVEATAL